MSSTLVAAPSADGTPRLHALIQSRDALRPMFLATWDALADRFDHDAMGSWATATLQLLDVNAGASCLIAFWDISKRQAPRDGPAPLIACAQSAAHICRRAGAKAATSTIVASTTAQRLLQTPHAMARWWRIMEMLSEQAPESVEAVASRTATILPAGDLDAFADFIAAGLKLASTSKQRRLAFFTLQDESARRLLHRASAGIGFSETERATKAFVTMLWGQPPLLRSLPVAVDQTQQRRSAIAGPLIRLPETYRGVQGDAARVLYRAAAAHAQAHLMLGGAQFPVGKLKPLQIALVTLIEDARIEALAMRQFPGLRRLWSPYHVAMPSGVATAPVLLARLARALFDPNYDNFDGFIDKGRRMFADVAARRDDPAISREIGVLLGNDLGQMRVQFNPKTYVVEPIYRDDGLGLWDFGDDAPLSGEVLDVPIDAARAGQRDAPGQDTSEPGDGDARQRRAKPVAPDKRGRIVATYPEWDRVQGVERADWTTVREVAATPGDPRRVDLALERADGLRTRVRQLVRSMRVGRTVRLKRQLDGHDLDVDAMLEAGIALKSGMDPDPRIFRTTAAKHRDLAVLLLIDISESTRDRLASGETILDVERLAVAVLAEAMSALGDPFCLLGFASNGRDDVAMTAVKHFGEPYDRACVTRLAGLASGQSTRLGAALRHAGATIGTAGSDRKLVIVLTDGEPSDIDVADSQDLVEDARRAAIGLRARGIDGFGVVLGPAGIGAAARIFGRGNTMLVNRVADLPVRLSELYFRLARR